MKFSRTEEALDAEQEAEMYKHRKCGLWCRLKQPRQSK